MHQEVEPLTLHSGAESKSTHYQSGAIYHVSHAQNSCLEEVLCALRTERCSCESDGANS